MIDNVAIDDFTVVVNQVALILFVGLLGAAVFRMVARLVRYRRAGKRPSVILRRDFALLFALLLVFGAAVLIRAYGLQPVVSTGWPRLVYVLVNDVTGVVSLGYWVWAEYFIIGKSGHEDD